MAIDPYDYCPCGSGKKFKWCCQPIHAQIDTAFAQHNDGQHEAALRTMQALVQEHAGNPEAHGRYAQLLALNGKVEEADQRLEQAFAIKPNYAFGYLLRGQFRLREGESIGALMLFRKAAEMYAPEARDALAYLHELIADLELRSNRPVAARAALKRAMHFLPSSEEIKKAFDETFGDRSRLPLAARKEYVFRAPANAPPGWVESLQRAATGKLGDALNAFQKLTGERPEDAAGVFNLALVKAWLGDNAGAIHDLDAYVKLEPDEAKAAEAWALAEVLVCGQGLESRADHVETRLLFPLRDPNATVNFLQKLEQAKRLIGMRADPENGVLTGLMLEGPGPLAVASGAPEMVHLQAYFMIAGNQMHLWGSSAERVERAAEEVRQALGTSANAERRVTGPVHFIDVVGEALLFPNGQTTELNVELKVRESASRFFEENWVHRPRKSLDNVPPIDAAGSPVLRKKLLGTIQFLEQCAAPSSLKLYDFDRLRRKLGLIGGPAATGGGDLTAMSAAELSAVDATGLTAAAAAEAFRAAMLLDAPELAARFAEALIEKPTDEPTADRFPYFNHLIVRALAEGQFDRALEQVDAGEKWDCEQNAGRRRNDYELRRAQVLVKRGDVAAAAGVFERLIARTDDIKYATSATETMLSAKAGDTARAFAERGLALARAKNQRDGEEHFLEMLDAANRLK